MRSLGAWLWRSSSRLRGADPAPSRIAYRLHRLWLTPTFRRVVRVVMPVSLGLVMAIAWITDEARIAAITQTVEDLRRSVEERPEFMVTSLEVVGASNELAAAIGEVMPVGLPVSSFDLSLESLQAQVESLDAVKRVDIRVRAGGVLEVAIQERVPAVIWRGVDGMEMLDAEGHRVQLVPSRHVRPDLPLIAGVGANTQTAEALALFRETGPIRERVIGLTRISELRWDVVLDRDQRILLPQANPGQALARVLAMHEAQDLLNRDITHVDMRIPTRPTLRLNAAAMDELRRIKGLPVVLKDN